MYYGNSGNGISQCKPYVEDYEASLSRLKKKWNVFHETYSAINKFIEVIGRHALSERPGTLPELLGNISLDLIDMEKEFANLEKLIENAKK